MYSFSVFEKSGIEPQANAVIYGIQAGLLPTGSVPAFEEYMVLNHGIEGSADLLVFDGNPKDAVVALSNAGYSDDGAGRDVLRVAILASLDSDGQDLLDDIDKVYADFGYPRDMEPFIYYMPNNGGVSSVSALIDCFHSFIATEKARLNL